mmetsp:Transcript_15228/g.33131  ORF Transcript_15228/g.33131 Transcript_15228/m.33131 type:complete len:257 (-) Transcript_15228:275-1045(-)
MATAASLAAVSSSSPMVVSSPGIVTPKISDIISPVESPASVMDLATASSLLSSSSGVARASAVLVALSFVVGGGGCSVSGFSFGGSFSIMAECESDESPSRVSMSLNTTAGIKDLSAPASAPALALTPPSCSSSFSSSLGERTASDCLFRSSAPRSNSSSSGTATSTPPPDPSSIDDIPSISISSSRLRQDGGGDGGGDGTAVPGPPSDACVDEGARGGRRIGLKSIAASPRPPRPPPSSALSSPSNSSAPSSSSS